MFQIIIIIILNQFNLFLTIILVVQIFRIAITIHLIDKKKF